MSSVVPSLRDRQTAATREQILQVAMQQLSQGPRGTFSHESIAEAAGMGARTVYRHFPDRSSLLEALWERLREAAHVNFPTAESDIVPMARAAYQEFDANELLVRAVLNSPAGVEVRDRGGVEGRAAFEQSLAAALDGVAEPERSRIIAVFVAIYSAQFWDLLRERSRLAGPDAQEAIIWALESLLRAAKEKK
jgi:AcrR family transcriptional regulator